jgi:hypothetical protein
MPSGVDAGRDFMEFDLVYVRNDMPCWGARNVDGRGLTRRRIGGPTCRSR